MAGRILSDECHKFVSIQRMAINFIKSCGGNSKKRGPLGGGF
jgi:hypothetical protein